MVLRRLSPVKTIGHATGGRPRLLARAANRAASRAGERIRLPHRSRLRWPVHGFVGRAVRWGGPGRTRHCSLKRWAMPWRSTLSHPGSCTGWGTCATLSGRPRWGTSAISRQCAATNSALTTCDGSGCDESRLPTAARTSNTTPGAANGGRRRCGLPPSGLVPRVFDFGTSGPPVADRTQHASAVRQAF